VGNLFGNSTIFGYHPTTSEWFLLFMLALGFGRIVSYCMRKEK
jgi:hypothetical protein